MAFCQFMVCFSLHDEADTHLAACGSAGSHEETDIHRIRVSLSPQTPCAAATPEMYQVTYFPVSINIWAHSGYFSSLVPNIMTAHIRYKKTCSSVIDSFNSWNWHSSLRVIKLKKNISHSFVLEIPINLELFIFLTKKTFWIPF